MTKSVSALLQIPLLLSAACASRFAQGQTPCPLPAALIAPGQPAYQDAMALKKNVESQGLIVRCIFETKFSSEFLDWKRNPPLSTSEGETCFRTNLGDLEVLFMWKPRTFSELTIKERRKGGWYVYSYSGMSDVWPRNIKEQASKERTYYFQHDNYLLSVGGEKRRDAVQGALHQAPRSL